MTIKKAKVGIVGCGNISSIYFKNGKWAGSNRHRRLCRPHPRAGAGTRKQEFDVPRAPAQ